MVGIDVTVEDSSVVRLGSWVVVGSGGQNCGNSLQTREQYWVLCVGWQKKRTVVASSSILNNTLKVLQIITFYL